MAENTPFTSIDYFLHNSFLGKKAPNGGEKGFLRQDRFKVEFELPTVVATSDHGNEVFPGYSSTDIAQFLSDNIITIEAPSFTLAEEETPLRHNITRRTTDVFTVTFFEDPTLSVKNVMWNWIDKIVRQKADNDNFERHYLDEIIGKIKIKPIKYDGNTSNRYDVLDYVFPRATSPITYDIGQENEVGKISVTFKYRFHYMESI